MYTVEPKNHEGIDRGVYVNNSYGEESTGQEVIRWRLEVSGIVQGVGFRPFVHNLAHQLGVSGWVRNTSTGVQMELQASPLTLACFYRRLLDEAPSIARILAVDVIPITPEILQPPGFTIRPSHALDGRTLVSPDVATCLRCQHELFDPADRRFHYPFTNCTHCGPRFTIVTALPYDRPNTTMSSFPMCTECAWEYHDAQDRRFHAQPVACPNCGPLIWYAAGSRINAILPQNLDHDRPGGSAADLAIAAAVSVLEQGGIIALKGLGGFHIACSADQQETVDRLRTVKHRPHKPLAVMVRSVEEAREFSYISPIEQALLLSPEAPIVLLRKHTEAPCQLAPAIAPENGYVGVMLPYTPLHHMLLQEVTAPLVMTSGNQSGEPLCIDNDEAAVQLSFVDGFLLHNRPIARRCDDSVMFVAQSTAGSRETDGRDAVSVQPVRRSRGLVPTPVLLPTMLALPRPLVAAGADLKNVAAVAVDRHVFLTQHIGDLSSPNVRREQARVVADFEALFHVQPGIIACDRHPDYASSRYARRRAEQEGLQLVEVQHHHAHIAACLAENHHTDPAIGLSFDGTGYGADGVIWGGEAFLADLADFRRFCHLEYLPLPGGDAATRRPYRIALAYLRTLLPELELSQVLTGVPETEIKTIDVMLKQQVNTPLTSSMGRLFDAVSALLGLCRFVTYEAQAAIALENAALTSQFHGPGYSFTCDGQVRLASLFAQIVFDQQSGVPLPDIARRFHITIAHVALAMAQAVQQEVAGGQRVGRHPPDGELAPVNTVALSGGVWQNRLLLALTVPLLKEAGFQVLFHHAVPANDGGIAYGQAVVAAARLARV